MPGDPDPAYVLARKTLLEDALRHAGFALTDQPGIWKSAQETTLDLLVPASLGGKGRRGARLGVHGSKVARKVVGLEAALLDKASMPITALDPKDDREHQVLVAGPAALLVSKAHKIADRKGRPGRQADKDALDVLRLLQAISSEELAKSLSVLARADLSGQVTRDALDHLKRLFESARAPGSQMAARAVGLLENPATIAASCEVLLQELLYALKERE